MGSVWLGQSASLGAEAVRVGAVRRSAHRTMTVRELLRAFRFARQSVTKVTVLIVRLSNRMVGMRVMMLVDSGGSMRAAEQNGHGQKKGEKTSHGQVG